MNKQADGKQSAAKWIKDEKEPGLYRYGETYYARVKIKGKQKTRSLHTHDWALARRLLAQLRVDLAGLDHTVADPSLAALCERYRATFEHQKPKTVEAKRLALDRVCDWWPTGASVTPVGKIRASHCDEWLGIVARRSKSFGPTSRNGYIEFLKSLFAYAVANRWILSSPAMYLKRARRTKPVRLTPTFEQFQEIVASVRAQKFNGRGAERSGDFLEAEGLLGLGQAEIRSLTRANVDLERGQISLRREKTGEPFTIPIYPQARALIEKVCEGRRHSELLFSIKTNPKHALRNACDRLGYPNFSQRSLRRMFITRAIERGIDVKVIAAWQDHADGGKLILDTYSHLFDEHSRRMAALMTTAEPDNVLRMPEAEKASS